MFDPLSTREPATTQRYGHLRGTPAGGTAGSLLPGVALRAANHRRYVHAGLLPFECFMMIAFGTH